jgi:hypothetical protein
METEITTDVCLKNFFFFNLYSYGSGGMVKENVVVIIF